MERDSFVFYRAWYEAARERLSEKAMGEFLHAVMELGLYGERVEVKDPAAAFGLDLVAPQIEANNKRYLNGLKGKEYGKLGGHEKGWGKGNQNARKYEKEPQDITETTPKQTPNDPQTTPKQTPNDNVNVNVNDISKETTNVVKKATQPKKARPESMEQLQAYIDEYAAKTGITPDFNAQSWTDTYEAVGWVIGKARTPMKDWRAAVRNWFNMRKSGQITTYNKPNSYGTTANTTDANTMRVLASLAAQEQ